MLNETIMRRYLIVTGIIAVAMGWLGLSKPTQALVVNSFSCSNIDTQDGNIADWENIDFLINTEESVAGTTYYLDQNDEWTTTEPTTWQYSANLEQQANIQQMKVCNTDTFFMMLRTEQPMMTFYDKDQDAYVDFWSSPESGEGFTLPADYHYWMVWKMQDAAGEGNIVYFAADLRMDAGRELSGEERSDADHVPHLYLYEEGDEGVTFDDAAFDPAQDTQLTEIEVSNDNEESCNPDDPNYDPSCQERDAVAKTSYAFEVSQDISQLFQYADFDYGDTINMSAAMYNSDEFVQTSQSRRALQVIDETETAQYTFSQKAVRGLTLDDDSVTESSAALEWKKMKNAKSYQIKLLNPTTDKTIRIIKNIRNVAYTVRALKAATSYRAVVRAVLPKKQGKKQFSAWSSGVRWTTSE